MANTHLYDIIDVSSLSYHLENSPLGVIVFDNNLHISYWSPRAAEIFEWGKTEADHHQLSFQNLVYETDIPQVASLLKSISSGNARQINSTNRNYTKNGRIIFCEWYNSALTDDSGNIISILSFVLDITERKKIEQQLKNSEQQLSLIYNSAIDSMWLIDVEGKDKYRFKDINASFTTVTGLTREQVIGKRIEEVLPESSHELVRTKYNEAVSTGKVVDYVEVAVHPAGKKYGEIRVVPVKNNKNEVTKIVGIANDITEKRLLRIKLEKERDEFNRRVTAAAIKGQEIERTTVSRELHDNVNQVLTTVKLYIELCNAGSVDVSTVLPKCVDLLNDSINEIRNLSKRLSAPSLGDAGFLDTMKDLVETVQATKTVDISLDASAVQCTEMDSELHLALYRIAQEHLTNILKHANAQKVTINITTEPNKLSLLIQDDGQGFDTQQKQAGIGITNMISRAHIFDGDLHIESAVGKGTTLQVSIPIEIVDGKCFPLLKK